MCEESALLYNIYKSLFNTYVPKSGPVSGDVPKTVEILRLITLLIENIKETEIEKDEKGKGKLEVRIVNIINTLLGIPNIKNGLVRKFFEEIKQSNTKIDYIPNLKKLLLIYTKITVFIMNPK